MASRRRCRAVSSAAPRGALAVPGHSRGIYGALCVVLGRGCGASTVARCVCPRLGHGGLCHDTRRRRRLLPVSLWLWRCTLVAAWQNHARAVGLCAPVER